MRSPPVQNSGPPGAAVIGRADARALLVCDGLGQVHQANKAWSHWFAPPGGPVPSLLEATLYAHAQDGVQQLLRALELGGGAVQDLQLPLRRHDGSVFMASVQCTRLQAGGQTWYTAWIGETAGPDDAPSRLPPWDGEPSLLHQLQVGIVLTGGGKILRANAKFAQIFEFADARAAVGRDTACLYEDAAEAERVGAELARTLAQEANYRGTWSARRQDGSRFMACGRASTVTLPDAGDATVWIIEDEAEIRDAEEIRKENESYSRMFQQSHIAISIYDPATDCYVDCNEAARKLYGFERAEDLRGRTVLSISAPMQERGPTEKILAAGRRNLNDTGRESPSFEWRHRRPDGTDWMAECRGTTFRYRGRTLIQFTLIDITAAKETQRQVKEMAVFLQTMIDRMPNAVFYKGPDTRLLGCNEAFERALGVQRADLVGKRVDELEQMPEALRAQLQAEDERVIAEAAHVQRETTFPFADGRTHQVLYSVSGFRQRDGSPGGLVGVIVDLEALKAAENALGVAQKEQAAMFEAAGVGIAFVRDGTMARCNRELESMFGYAPGELQGRPIGIWYGGDADHAAARLRLRQLIGAPRDSLHDQEFVRKDGARFWGRVTARYIHEDTSQGSVWFMEDVTEER
ncbi:PAS domain-containing protein, partial [Pseudorhodoferax aquiterrae]|uniref:PAS domain-containing protein n=1 Tax=Pseudorhodoferax aquiterrae TaxID=747304 RepID=UPI0016739544